MVGGGVGVGCGWEGEGRRGKEGEEDKEEWLGRYKLSSSLMFVAPSHTSSATTL